MIKDNKGQIMVESIIAITVGVIALTGVLNLLTNSIGINRDVGQRTTASYLAMEGIEVTKSLISENYTNERPWNDGLPSGSYEFVYDTMDPTDAMIAEERSQRNIYFNPSNSVYNYNESGVETRFMRTIQIESLRGSEEMRVRSIVEWVENGNDREVILEDHFFDWRPN